MGAALAGYAACGGYPPGSARFFALRALAVVRGKRVRPRGCSVPQRVEIVGDQARRHAEPARKPQPKARGDVARRLRCTRRRQGTPAARCALCVHGMTALTADRASGRAAECRPARCRAATTDAGRAAARGGGNRPIRLHKPLNPKPKTILAWPVLSMRPHLRSHGVRNAGHSARRPTRPYAIGRARACVPVRCRRLHATIPTGGNTT